MKKKTCDGCGIECYLWKARSKTQLGLCKSCALKQSTPIGNIKIGTKTANEGEKKPYKPRSPINKRSDKKKKIDAAYKVLRGRYMKDHPICQFRECNRKSEETHHIRGRGKEYMLDTREWMAVCKIHHDWIHANDKESRELGYLKSRLGK